MKEYLSNCEMSKVHRAEDPGRRWGLQFEVESCVLKPHFYRTLQLNLVLDSDYATLTCSFWIQLCYQVTANHSCADCQGSHYFCIVGPSHLFPQSFPSAVFVCIHLAIFMNQRWAIPSEKCSLLNSTLTNK